MAEIINDYFENIEANFDVPLPNYMVGKTALIWEIKWSKIFRNTHPKYVKKCRIEEVKNLSFANSLAPGKVYSMQILQIPVRKGLHLCPRWSKTNVVWFRVEHLDSGTIIARMRHNPQVFYQG